MFKADTKKLDEALKEEVVAETAVFDGRLMHVRRLEVSNAVISIKCA